MCVCIYLFIGVPGLSVGGLTLAALTFSVL